MTPPPTLAQPAPPRPVSAAGLRAITRQMPLFLNLVRREVRQRYKGSTLGLVWTLITPAIMVGAYSLVFRYLLRAVRDTSVAEDLTQEFALRFIQGRFGNANPDQGKFRNYVKSALFRLVQDHYRERMRARA